MITIKSAVKQILATDYVAIQSMSRRIMNLSEYARSIKPDVELLSKKEVGIQSIVVSLARIEKELSYTEPGEVTVEQLSLQAPITQLIYPRTTENSSSLAKAMEMLKDLDTSFFSFSTSTKDIAILASDSVVEKVTNAFLSSPTIKSDRLSAVSIRFPEKGVQEANVGLRILSKLATRSIPLAAAITTYNEFTLVTGSTHMEEIISALAPVQ